MTPAGRLGDTTGLDEVEQAITSSLGSRTIMYETRKAEQRRQIQAHRPSVDDLASVDGMAAEARTRGTDFISIRPIDEILGAVWERPNNYRLSAYSTNLRMRQPRKGAAT